MSVLKRSLGRVITAMITPFNEDGTGEMSISGIQLNITYTVDGDTLTVNKTVLDEFDKNGIEIPFNQMDVHIINQ